MTDAFRFFLECVNLFFIIYLIGYSSWLRDFISSKKHLEAAATCASFSPTNPIQSKSQYGG